jgi:prepilin-type processing-associated H-X9-DG protein
MSATHDRHRAAVTLVELLVVIAIIGFLVALLLPVRRGPREPARRLQCMSNLKQIANALKQYETVHHTLPPAYTTDPSGKPLHSWRTLILPFFEEQELYDSIDLTKSWDDPANAAALKKCPLVYQCPSAVAEDDETTYLAVVTPNSCFQAEEPRALADIRDPAKETLTVIEVGRSHAVPWMSPVDADEKLVLEIDAPQTRAPHVNGMNAAFVDGSVQFLMDTTTPEVRRALISIDGGDSKVVEGAE